MVRKYIKRDWTDHARSTEYLSDTDEYIKFEIFSFDPDYTQSYVVEQGSLKGENAVKTKYRSLTVFRSKDRINPMEFTLRYNAKTTGEYRIDILYEQNDSIYNDVDKVYNTSKDLTGWYDIYPVNSKAEHKANTYTGVQVTSKTPDIVKKTMQKLIDATANKSNTGRPRDAIPLKFEGANNVLKRKTIFVDLNADNYKIEFAVPHNCYVIGALVRKIKRFWGTNNDEVGSQLQFTSATLTNSEMLKPTELQCDIGYDDDFECEKKPTGLYMDYMDECNLYVKNNEGKVVRIFGGYISTPLPDNDRKELNIHCADRLKDGENKYILNQIMLQKGDGSEQQYTDEDSVSFNSYDEVLRYLCELYECTLKHNINQIDADKKKYRQGFEITFGKKKDVKKVKANNGTVTINKNHIVLRNNSSGKKKQLFKLWEGKKNLSQYNTEKYPLNLHIRYGLGNPRTEHKRKETSNVDTADVTAGSQKFSKCGVSADKKYVMGIGQRGVGRGAKTYPYSNLYKSVFENKCPYCGKPALRWDSARSDTKCLTCKGSRNGTKKHCNIPETEITCNACSCDFDIPTGYSKEGSYKYRLKKVGSTRKSSKSEQNKLHKGEMVALPKSNVKITSDDIFKAIKNTCKGYKYDRGKYSTASQLEKHGKGDCHAWSEKISKELKKYKVNHKVVQYATSESPNGTHRSVLYQNSKGDYVNFPYKEYGFPSMLYPTSGAKHPNSTIIKWTAGGRIDQAVVSGSTTKTQTVEKTITKGYDKDKPFQAYLDICFSLGSKPKKYHVYVDFTQKAKSDNTISGLKPVWVNNSTKKITLTGIVDKIKDYYGGTTETIYLRSLSFITPKIVTTKEDKNTDWYTNDKTTEDNSSCKIRLYDISFTLDRGSDPGELDSCGKTVNDLLKTIVEDTGYLVYMEYGKHRCDDKINFKINDNSSPVYTAMEGDNNNILEWGNISYNPANELYNVSRCVFKKNKTNKYYYVETKDINSILQYQEQCTLLSENEEIGEKEAYWNARHNDKYNPEQTYSYTITVLGVPDIQLKELVEVIADMRKLNTLKELESFVLKYDYKDKPVLQSELGLGELAPDIQVRENIKKLRNNAKKADTIFYGTATPVSDEEVYEWED